MTTQPVSPHTAAKRSVCPVCAAELLPARAMVAPFRRHPRACRFTCRACLAVVRVREQVKHFVADVEVPGPVVVRRLEALREARELGNMGEELARMRESRAHRLLLRVPEVFAEARPFFRERATLAVNVRFDRGEAQPVFERYEAELATVYRREVEHWSCTPFSGAGGAYVLPAGWTLPIAGIEGTHVSLKPHVWTDAPSSTERREPRPLPSGIARLLAPLDVLAPEDGVW